MSEERFCYNEKCKSNRTDYGNNCKKYSFVNIENKCSEVLFSEYPKPATFMEAVEWMELGYKAQIGNCNFDVYIKNGCFMFDSFMFDKSTLVMYARYLTTEWQLLPPEKKEKKKDVKKIQDLIKAIKNIIQEYEE